MRITRKLLQEATNLLEAFEYSEKGLGDGCEICGRGETILRECPYCGFDDPRHGKDCPLLACLAELKAILGTEKVVKVWEILDPS